MSAQGLKILVIGGGFSGMSAAIQLRKAGRERGSRRDRSRLALVRRRHHARRPDAARLPRRSASSTNSSSEAPAADGVDLFTSSGHRSRSLPTPRLAGPDVPGAGAIMRPVLAAILAEATKASGTTVRLGATFSGLESAADGVRVRLTDGSEADYDLVIGADGL